jgi:hypothetical protein
MSNNLWHQMSMKTAFLYLAADSIDPLTNQMVAGNNGTAIIVTPLAAHSPIPAYPVYRYSAAKFVLATAISLQDNLC